MFIMQRYKQKDFNFGFISEIIGYNRYIHNNLVQNDLNRFTVRQLKLE